MLTMLQTAAYYLDIAKAEREAEAAVGRTLIFNGMTDNDVAAYRERRLRLRELVAQRAALAVVLELNAPTGVEIEALPLVPVQTPAEQARRERMSPINIFAVGAGGDGDAGRDGAPVSPESSAYPDVFLMLLPPRADGVRHTLRAQPVALLLTREELAELRACGQEALLDGSVHGSVHGKPTTPAAPTEPTGEEAPRATKSTLPIPSTPEPRPISVSRPLARPLQTEEQAS